MRPDDIARALGEHQVREEDPGAKARDLMQALQDALDRANEGAIKAKETE